ncbi:MAG: hypothetical protein JNK94_06655 [Hyphomonadaceae bacterium]|nr:hypothetical protein [Hyphomonadaceae bacterium]
MRWYWQMEAANIVLLPALAGGVVWQSGGAATAAFLLAAAACSWLLLIGALYWRALLRRMEGAAAVFDYWLPRLAAVEGISAASVLAAAIIFALELAAARGEWSASLIAAAALTTLAALEYVNYYRIQLQHFDNVADFKRLIAGRGFRRAHMARDIAAWRASSRRKHRAE